MLYASLFHSLQQQPQHSPGSEAPIQSGDKSESMYPHHQHRTNDQWADQQCWWWWRGDNTTHVTMSSCADHALHCSAPHGNAQHTTHYSAHHSNAKYTTHCTTHHTLHSTTVDCLIQHTAAPHTAQYSTPQHYTHCSAHHSTAHTAQYTTAPHTLVSTRWLAQQFIAFQNPSKNSTTHHAFASVSSPHTTKCTTLENVLHIA